MRTSLWSFALLGALSSVAVADPSKDYCSRLLRGELKNSGEPLSPGGGVVVAAKFTPEGGCFDDACNLPPPGTDPTLEAAWHFEINDKQVEAVRTPLAPGLTLYEAPKGVSKFRIQGTHENTPIDVGGNKPTLDAPKIKRVFQVKEKRQLGGSFSSVIVLDNDRQRDTLALIVYGSDGKARDWVPAPHKDIAADFGHERDTCEYEYPGHVVTQVGDKVRFAWVDRSGRLSPKSDEWEVIADTRLKAPPPRPAKKGLRPGF
jgi:hypothetical protein